MENLRRELDTERRKEVDYANEVGGWLVGWLVAAGKGGPRGQGGVLLFVVPETQHLARVCRRVVSPSLHAPSQDQVDGLTNIVVVRWRGCCWLQQLQVGDRPFAVLCYLLVSPG